MTGGFRSPVEAALIQAVVHDNPRREDEGALHYIERIAILSGLMPPGRAAFTTNAQLGKPGVGSSESARSILGQSGLITGQSGESHGWQDAADSDARREELARQAERIREL